MKEKIVSSGGRLDRGLSIARSKDKVFDTHVQGNVVTTKVRGNNRPFYNVRSEWRRLSGQDKRMVLTMVRSNLLWLGRILNGDLPLELLSALEKAGIALLPKNLKEMGTSCNCPDAAGYRYRGAAALRAGQVCKHQAALIFAIVAEIDKDAFQLFKLRGLDLVRELSGNNEVERDAVTGIQNRLLLTSAPEVLTLEHPEEDDVIVLDASDVECDSDVEILDTHTLDAPRKTRLPLRAPKLQNHAKFLLSCLPKSPAFSTRVDFKIVLEQFYAYVNRKKTATLLREELDWEKPILAKDENGSSPLEILESGLRRSSFELHLDPGFCIERATFSVRGECFRSHRMSKVISLLPGAKLDGDCFTVGACILLRVLSKTKDIHVGPSPSYLYFRNIVRASHWLFLRNACVPSVVPTSQNTRSWRALFVPFTGQEGQPIAELIRSLVELYPENNPVQLQKRALSKEAGTEQALGLLMTKLVHSIKFLPRGAANKAPKLITSALFQGEVFQPLTLRDQGTGAAVQRWFGVLDLFKLNVDVEMRLDYGRDGAYNLTLQLKKANRAGRFVSARDFFAKGLTQPVHFSAIRFLASIETFLPGNAKALLSRGRTRLSEADFETFLLDQTPLLKALGIQLVLPKQMSKVHVPRMVVLARLRKKGLVDEEDIDEEDYDEDDCKAMHLPYLKVKQLVDFDASIAIGDTVITMEEFEALVRQGRRVMRYKDKYIHVTPEQALKLLQQARQRQIELDEGVAVPTALDLMRASLGKDYKSLVWLDKGVNDQMKKLFTSDKIGHPKGMNCTLRPYQITGFEWLVATTTKMGGALLADDMGLGKTIQSIAVLHYQKSLGRLSPQKPALVVAPTSLMANWASEIARFAPGISTNVYCGPKRDLGNKTDVILTTYTTACKDLAKLGQLDLSIMVIDEAQNIKNHWTKTAKSIKQLGKKKTIMRIALTGTPVENRLAELHSIFEFILPGWFPSLKQFHSEYAMPIQQYGDPEAVVMLKMMTAPFLMRRLKTELLSELPPKIMNNRLVCLSKVSCLLLYCFVISLILESI